MATVGKRQNDNGLIWRASYAAAEKTKIFMALKIAEGSESLCPAQKTITESGMLTNDFAELTKMEKKG